MLHTVGIGSREINLNKVASRAPCITVQGASLRHSIHTVLLYCTPHNVAFFSYPPCAKGRSNAPRREPSRAHSQRHRPGRVKHTCKSGPYRTAVRSKRAQTNMHQSSMQLGQESLLSVAGGQPLHCNNVATYRLDVVRLLLELHFYHALTRALDC